MISVHFLEWLQGNWAHDEFPEDLPGPDRIAPQDLPPPGEGWFKLLERPGHVEVPQVGPGLQCCDLSIQTL